MALSRRVESVSKGEREREGERGVRVLSPRGKILRERKKKNKIYERFATNAALRKKKTKEDNFEQNED